MEPSAVPLSISEMLHLAASCTPALIRSGYAHDINSDVLECGYYKLSDAVCDTGSYDVVIRSVLL